MILNKVWVDIGRKEFILGFIYVVISRVYNIFLLVIEFVIFERL